MGLVSYRIEGDGKKDTGFATYIMHEGGVSIAAENQWLKVRTIIAPGYIPGLPYLKDEFELKVNPMPAYRFEQILEDASRNSGLEELYYCHPEEAGWRIIKPSRIRTPGSVQATDIEEAQNVLLEVHSHGRMKAFFSATDNDEESGCLRLFAVLGQMDTPVPEVRLRVGIYNHFWELPIDEVVELPKKYEDLNGID